MDCLYWCPSIYYYIQLFLHFISYYLITYIISLINCLKSNSNVLILIVITFYLYLNFFYIILLFFYQNLQNLYITVFSLFYRQQTISLKNKNGLKSILVRRFFEVFFHFFIYLYKHIKISHFLSKNSQTQNYQYFAKILNNKLYGLSIKMA